MNKIENISQYFIEKGINDFNEVNLGKLQKLLYLAYGFYYALYRKKMINNNIYAHKFGPLFHEIYNIFGIYGNEPIHNQYQFITGKFNTRRINKKTKNILDMVWFHFGKLDYETLFMIANKPDGPCEKTRKELDNYNQIISEKNILEYFEQLILKK